MTSSLASETVDRRTSAGLVLLAAALIALVLGSFMMGRYPLSLKTVMDVLLDPIFGNSRVPDVARTVVLTVRLPRIIAAAMIGVGLSMAGAAYQSLFHNPMASPDLLGVSEGASFGAALALLFHQPFLIVQVASFAVGLATVLLVLSANRVFGGRSIVTLLLCGMVLAALFQALISVIKYIADPFDVLPAITFWLMGSLARTDMIGAVSITVPVLLCAAVLYANRWRIDALGAGDEAAMSLGVDVRRTKIVMIVCATLMSAATVSVAGIIGWVGLLIPHVARMLFGLEPSKFVPGTALLGGLFVLMVDDLARSLSVIEVPIGILTAIIGAPFFLFLLLRARREYWA